MEKRLYIYYKYIIIRDNTVAAIKMLLLRFISFYQLSDTLLMSQNSIKIQSLHWVSKLRNVTTRNFFIFFTDFEETGTDKMIYFC